MDERVKENINRYRSESYAQRYKREYTYGSDFKNFRSRIIANREVAIIRNMLKMLYKNGGTLVLDVPCGTGKLGKMLNTFPIKILSGDISKEMMALASEEYSKDKLLNFLVFDAQSVPIKDKSIDTIVCLRLFQRLPADLRKKILFEFSRICKEYVIISYSYTSFLQKVRLFLRGFFIKEPTAIFNVKWAFIKEELNENRYAIKQINYVLKGLCSEVIILLKTNFDSNEAA